MILLVAIVLLFVVGAMAALSIDVVTFYTARSEAQLAADSAALAGARALANSGMTSDPNALSDGMWTNTKPIAVSITNEIAMRNDVGGRTLFPGNGEVAVSFNEGDPSFATNPRITVATRRTDLPTFFARIWGRATVTVQATATAEVYNPSGASLNAPGTPVVPVAPMCVKPWVLPNISPSVGGGPIFDPNSGRIVDSSLVGKDISGTKLQPVCATGQCSKTTWFPGTPSAWQFYSGDQSSFPAPSSGLPSCVAGFNDYQNSVAGCVQTPIACGSSVVLETTHAGLHQDTRDAVNCVTHAPNSSTNISGDSIDTAFGVPPNEPYQFLTGAGNPLVQAGTLNQGVDVMVSDSIVAVPVYDTAAPPTLASPSVTVIGFVQLFLNQDGMPSSNLGVATRVINIAGCGTNLAPQPILGNGASPVPVRLISGP